MKRSKLKFKTCFMPKTYDFTGKMGLKIMYYYIWYITLTTDNTTL